MHLCLLRFCYHFNGIILSDFTNNMQQRQNKANECVKELAEMITDQILQSSKMRPVVNQINHAPEQVNQINNNNLVHVNKNTI